MERKFKSHMVDVRGLSRKEAKEKRKRAYREFMLYRDLKEAYHADTGKDKCKRSYITNIRQGKHKQHLNRSRVFSNIGAALFLYPTLSIYGYDILRVNDECGQYWSKTKQK